MRYVRCVLLAAALGACGEPEVTQPTTPSAKPALVVAQFALYHVDNLPHLGGALSEGNGIANRGLVSGVSRFLDGRRHAVLWRDGALTDLGTLGGRHSAVIWAGMNNAGMVVGISQTGILDTLPGGWSCSAFIPASDSTCVGFVHDGGVMTALPTLGGDNGFATGVNSRGQVVGWAETPVHDPTCDLPDQLLQFRAVLWEPRKGTKQELPPHPGDSTSAATAINEKGQVAGISGECDVGVGRFSARRSIVWTDGVPEEIPNLGGVSWHTPMTINQDGDVAGFSNPADPRDLLGEFIARAFIWTREGGTQEIGRLPGDSTSQALGINSARQVVGFSSGDLGNRAFIWQDGSLVDLNTLVEPDYPDSLVIAQDISDEGVITGRAFERSTGRFVAFIATPIPAP